MNIKITIFILFLISISSGLADEAYPNSYKLFEYLQGGEIIVTKHENQSNLPITYFVKPNWTEEAEVLYFWRGYKWKDARGSSIGSANIISSFPLFNSILSVWRENNRIFVAIIDTGLTMSSVTEIPPGWKSLFPLEVKWLGKTGSNEYLLYINNTIYLVNIGNKKDISIKLIASDVFNAISLFDENKNSAFKAAYLIYRDGSGVVMFLTKDNIEKFSSRMPVSDDIYLKKFGSQIAIISSSKSYPNSLMKIIDPERGVIAETWVEASGERVITGGDLKPKTIYFLKNEGAYYNLKYYNYANLKSTNPQNPVEIPKDLIEPMGLYLVNDIIYSVFRNGLATFNIEGSLLSVDFFPFGENFSQAPKLSTDGNYLILSTQAFSVILEKKNHQFWIFNRFVNNFGKILLPLVLSIIIIVVFNMYRGQKRLMRAVFNLPSTGAVFIIDQYARLSTANTSGKRLIGITDNIPLKRVFQYYCEFEHTKPILELVEKALSTKDTFTQKMNIVRNNDMYEWFWTVIPIRNAAGLYRGFVMTGIDITEQLERKRLSNWAQLAHDMQTNLSTIRLNAQQLDVVENTNDFERRKKIIHQVSLLIQRVRDIVTVGRSDAVNKEIIDSYEICHEVRSEFDEAVFPHVKFLVDAQHFNIICDKPKLIRAVRNAVENGIRSMQGKEGTITITNWSDSRYACIGVRDTGAGMDEVTKAKMLTPYFTTAKTSGGHGIGTMIMQHVMELHGGEIIINSEKGKGTQIVFCVPNYAHNKTSKAIAEKVLSLKGENK